LNGLYGSKKASHKLQKLPGVGRKVADCISLFSLGAHAAVPVDTHIWALTKKVYAPRLKAAKNITDAICNEIAEVYSSVFGEYAGWAHSVLFLSEIASRNKVKVDPKSEKTK